MSIFIKVIDTPIITSVYVADLSSGKIGAVAEFSGIVRDSEGGKPIIAIEYEAFKEMAEHQMELLAKKYIELYKLNDFLCIHRIGSIPVGESSLFIRIISAHRTEAFSAMMDFINELKELVPIWKHPEYLISNNDN